MMEVFRDVREGMASWASRKPDCKVRQKLAYLVTCPFCMSAYVSAFFLFLHPTKLLATHQGGYVIAWFAIQALAYPMLTVYHSLRVGLRWAKACADTQEALLAQIKIGADKASDDEETYPRLYKPMNGNRFAGHSIAH